MNNGTISIMAYVVTSPHTVHAIERDAIALQIIDDLEPGGARGNYTQAWPGGVVRPMMTWTFDFEPLDNEAIGVRDIGTQGGA